MELRTLTSPPRWSQTSPLFCAHFSTTLLAFTGKFSPECKKFWSLQSSIHINVESTWKQSWLPTFINVVSTLIFDWKWKLSRRIFIDVVSTLTKQRWQNYVDSTSMNQCCFNFEIWLKMKVEPTYVYRRCFNVDKTTLKQHWQVDSSSITQCCFNVNS